MSCKLQIFVIALFASALHCPAKEADDPTSSELPNGDLLIGDFEQRDLGRVRAWGWQLDGQAFNREFQHGTRQLRTRVGRHAGRWFLSSLGDGSGATGTATSPPFSIVRPAVEFRLSGGADPQNLSANLLVDGQTVRTATGKNDDLFERVAFDVAEFVGKEARFQVIDRSTKGIWGHINIDHIVQTANPRAKEVIDSPPAKVADESGSVTMLGSMTRHHGPFNIRGGQLITAGDRSVALERTLLISTGNPASGRDRTDALVLANGERWFGRIAGLENGEVTLHGRSLGNRKVPLAGIASLEFNITTLPTGGEANTLYRAAGEPVPGKLVWIRDKDIAIDCALGVIPIPRESVRRFVLTTDDNNSPATGDELSLTDGSLIRGSTRLEGDRLLVTHPVLGELNFEISAVDSLRRHPQNVAWLSRMRPASFESDGPLLPPPRPLHLETADGSALRVHPRSKITYTVPDLGAGAHRFRTTASPAPGNRGRVEITAICGSSTYAAHVDPDDEPGAVDLPLRPGAAVELTVAFIGEASLAFPCAIDWREPHFVALDKTQPEAVQDN